MKDIFFRFMYDMVYTTIEKNEMGGACSSVGGGERRVQGFGRKT
jgi:hypothetical protein